MSRTAKLDTAVTIVTPENIEFSYRLAGPFRRLGAAIVDAVLKVAVLVILIVAFAFTGIGSAIGGGIISFLFFVIWFLIDWFYGMVWETLWSGQTPGKRLFSLRVIACDGRPITAVQATLRNLLRVADLGVPASIQIFDPELPPGYLFPTFTVGMLTMTLTRRFQRLGDLAADTMVIVEERAWQPVLFKIEDPRAAVLADFIPTDFVVPLPMAKALSLYVAKRSLLPISRRHELAKHLATPLIEKFGFLSDTSPDLMMCALYLHAFYSKSLRENIPRTSFSPLKGSSPQATLNPIAATLPSNTEPSLGGLWESLDKSAVSSVPPPQDAGSRL
jgi:uncharacterized RDD family membrane protein YckC